MKWSLGFGLENLGILALKFPRLATVFLLATIIASSVFIPRIGFDGNVVNVLDSRSGAFKDFIKQATRFHSFSGDVVVIVENENLKTAETFEAIRDLHLDLTLEDGVEEVFSVFTLGEASPSGDEAQSIIPAEFRDDAHVRSSLEAMVKDEPAVSSLISLEKNALLMMVRLADDIHESDTGLNAGLAVLRQQVKSLSPEGTKIAFSGMPQIRASIVSAIIQDQTVLTSAGIVLGCIVAWFIFGNIRSAILCTVPAFLSVVWIIALFAGTGVKLNFFTTALPVLALIIAFADTIVLYFRWQSLSAALPRLEGLRAAIRQVGPASSLTSITTALAFGSFAWADSHSMDALAFFGVFAVLLAFLAVIVGLPIAGYWSLQFSKNQMAPKEPRFNNFGKALADVVTRRPVTVFFTAIAMLIAFTWAHFQLKPSYAISEYLPYNSEIRASEKFADDVFGGTSRYYVLLNVTDDGTFDDAVNRDRLQRVHEVVEGHFGEVATRSLTSIWKRLDASQIEKFKEDFEEAAPSMRGRFISEDNRLLQVSASKSASENTLKSQDRIEALRASLGELSFSNDITVTGLSVLMAEEFPKLIEELRMGLIFSIFLAVGVVAIATRNTALAIASLIPNLLPILFTESVMWASGASLSVTNVIGLTIAFGIAIDNAVHVINSYASLAGRGLNIEDRVRTAVGEIAPALFASTGIVCVSAIITQFSSMPSVSELGLLLIATLIVALISNLVVLPSSIIVMLRLKSRLRFDSGTLEKG